MANYIYDKARKGFLEGVFNVTSNTLKVALVTAGYTASQANDQYYSDVTPGSNVVGTPQTLGSLVDTAGTLKAANVTFSAVTGSAVTQLVIYKDTGTNSTSPLIARIGTAAGSPGLPVTPNGGDIQYTIDPTSGIFTL